MKHIKLVVAIASMISATAYAGSHTGAPMVTASAPDATLVRSDTPMADGEVKKIDKETKKITLKHGEIKNLDMPGMTMVFNVDDAAMLNSVKVGDKVKFTADKKNGSMVVTTIQPTTK